MEGVSICAASDLQSLVGHRRCMPLDLEKLGEKVM
jgi:hypothetical protein